MKKNKQIAWLTDIDTIMEVYELAEKHGKKAGDNIDSEFLEIMKKRKKKIKYLGTTDQDIDMLTGNLRESGKKILNLNEIQRRNRRKK